MHLRSILLTTGPRVSILFWAAEAVSVLTALGFFWSWEFPGIASATLIFAVVLALTYLRRGFLSYTSITPALLYRLLPQPYSQEVRSLSLSAYPYFRYLGWTLFFSALSGIIVTALYGFFLFSNILSETILTGPENVLFVPVHWYKNSKYLKTLIYFPWAAAAVGLFFFLSGGMVDVFEYEANSVKGTSFISPLSGNKEYF